ncbi:MAG: hypothetical protein M5U01_02165 [Ardenticatenaceae bacterium]|nr:hypothetical protein [Ardenticatenaceae bacterium]
MALFLTFATPAFLQPRNLLNVGRQVSLIGIMAVGMTFVLIAREIDLSIGSIYALAGLVVGILIVNQWNLGAVLLAGLAIGLINGWLSTYGRLPSFITTLGMLSVVRGVALLITNGQPVTVNEGAGVSAGTLEMFYSLGQGRILVMHQGCITGAFDQDEFAEERILACAMGQAVHL